MKKQVISLLTVGLVAASTAAANAFSIEGTIFADYSSYSTNYFTAAQGTSIDNKLEKLNGFHYTRAYLTVKDKISDEVSVKLTLDQNNLTVPTIPASSTGLPATASSITENNVFVKNAFADIKVADFANIQGGLVPTPWIGYEESLWSYRYVSSVLVDKNGAITSADLGANLYGSFGDSGFSYNLGMYNGEGYQKTPNGAGSAFGGRLDYKFGNFGIAGMYWGETKRNGTLNYDPTRTVGMLYYKDDLFTLAGEYLAASDYSVAAAPAGVKFHNGTGYSFWGHTKFPGMEALRLVARYDSIKPNDVTTVGGDQTTLIYGLSYKVARTTEVGLFGESVNNPANGTGANVAGQTDSKFSVNLLTGF